MSDLLNDKKKYHREALKKHRLKYKNVRVKCEICDKDYQKDRKWEHEKTRIHQIKFLEKELEKYKNKI